MPCAGGTPARQARNHQPAENTEAGQAEHAERRIEQPWDCADLHFRRPPLLDSRHQQPDSDRDETTAETGHAKRATQIAHAALQDRLRWVGGIDPTDGGGARQDIFPEFRQGGVFIFARIDDPQAGAGDFAERGDPAGFSLRGGGPLEPKRHLRAERLVVFPVVGNFKPIHHARNLQPGQLRQRRDGTGQRNRHEDRAEHRPDDAEDEQTERKDRLFGGGTGPTLSHDRTPAWLRRAGFPSKMEGVVDRIERTTGVALLHFRILAFQRAGFSAWLSRVDYTALISKRRERFSELGEAVGDPTLFNDPKRATAILREHRRLQQTLELWEKLQTTRRNLLDNQELAKSDDPEFAAMAAEEIPGLESAIGQLGEDLQYALLPADPNEDRNALIEIRAGAGGDEASLFAGELMRLYQRYAEARGWKCEHLESSPSEVGGFKEVILKVSGDEVFRHLKYESGVHRVQRVPATETQGRVHTSTVTVAVLPEAEEVDIEIRQEDLRIEVCRSGGAGGQHVNRTESAVQIFHLPTGTYVRCEDGRSQIKNRETAMQILRTKLYEQKLREQQDAYSSHRRSLIGSGDRSEKIRTYNFPQSRVTDHRIGFTSHNLAAIMTGELGELTQELQKAEMADRLAEANG